MKTQIVIIFTLVLFAGMISSCTKDSIKEGSTKEVNNAENTSNSKTSVSITISWTKWGLKKNDCNSGNGLCHFKISIETGGDDEKSAIVQFDDGGNPFIEILVDETTVFNEENTNFLIEDNLFAWDEEGTKYMLPAGEYELNESIGEMGGYTIPVIY